MFELVSKVIDTKFAEAWGATLPVKRTNEAFVQPGDGKWVAYTIIPGDEEQLSIGEPKVERQLGALVFQIFQPKDTGERSAKKLADKIAAIFRYKQWAYTRVGPSSANVVSDGEAGMVLTTEQFTGGENLDLLITEDGVEIALEEGNKGDGRPVFTILFRAPRGQQITSRTDFFQFNLVVPYQADRLFN